MGGVQIRFHRPVSIRLKGAERHVAMVAEAGEILLHEWPNQTAKHKEAMRAVLGALRENGRPAAARSSFIAAAVEARLLISD